MISWFKFTIIISTSLCTHTHTAAAYPGKFWERSECLSGDCFKNLQERSTSPLDADILVKADGNHSAAGNEAEVELADYSAPDHIQLCPFFLSFHFGHRVCLPLTVQQLQELPYDMIVMQIALLYPVTLC